MGCIHVTHISSHPQPTAKASVLERETLTCATLLERTLRGHSGVAEVESTQREDLLHLAVLPLDIQCIK